MNDDEDLGPPLARAAAAACARAANAALALDPEGADALEALAGRALAVEIDGTGLRLLVRFEGGRVTVDAGGGEADVTVAGAPLALLDAVAGGGEDLPPHVRATGDVALAQAIARAAARLDIDWEEGLARVFGDSAGRQLARAAAGAFEFGVETVQRLLDQGGEYLQEEAELAPRAHEAERFAADVDRLRDDVERLEQRVARLDARAKSGSRLDARAKNRTQGPES